MKIPRKKWDENDLRIAVRKSKSVRQVIKFLGLIPAGGNYVQVKKYIQLYKVDTSHFSGQAWSKGLTNIKRPETPIEKILIYPSTYQSYKLKKRLFKEGLKKQSCEECGWKKMSKDGRIPLELDHINGRGTDNRITNLRILCPNCHSLKPTHRGRNKGKQK